MLLIGVSSGGFRCERCRLCFITNNWIIDLFEDASRIGLTVAAHKMRYNY